MKQRVPRNNLITLLFTFDHFRRQFDQITNEKLLFIRRTGPHCRAHFEPSLGIAAGLIAASAVSIEFLLYDKCNGQ